MPHAAHAAPNAMPPVATAAAADAPPAAPPPSTPEAPFGAPDAAIAGALAARAAQAFGTADPTLPTPAAGLLSPCIGVCRLDADRHHCVGCLRTLDEIRTWARSDERARRGVWTAVAARAGIVLPAGAGAGAAAGKGRDPSASAAPAAPAAAPSRADRAA